MRLAYADPPYPGQAKRHYGKNGDPFAGTVAEVDHAALLAQLAGFDGWALSTSAAALKDVLSVCPDETPVGVWYRTDSEPPGNRGSWWWSWEPVIFRPARKPATLTRDVLALPKNAAGEDHRIIGQKPRAFCEWVFRLMGAEPGDDLADLFPGSGAVGRAWDRFSTQLVLAPALDKEKGEHLGSPLL